MSEDVWQFRFYETLPDGKRARRARVVGTLKQYPTRADALRAIEPFRVWLNLGHRYGRPITVCALATRYIEQELPLRRHSTQQSYRSALQHWISAKWGDSLLDQVTPLAVEQWLRSLNLAPKTKLNLRTIFHVIYTYALRWNFTDRNPLLSFGRAVAVALYLASSRSRRSGVCFSNWIPLPEHGVDSGISRAPSKRDYGATVG
jgi:integrase